MYRFCEVGSGKKAFIESKAFFSQDTQGELPKVRKKYKKRGVQVVCPGIAKLSFRLCAIFTPYLVPRTGEPPVGTLRSLESKRGPPVC